MTDSLQQQLQTSLGTAYTIERELGGGGMSRVFVAEETAFGRRVVIKLLLPELVADVNVDRFRREIQVAARLQHPHIVPVIAAGESGGLPWYSMPFVDGESLRSHMTRSAVQKVGEKPSHLLIGEAIRILLDVARAFANAHERGIVHRDIKPDDVLLSGGSAMVADFGIAKALDAAKLATPGDTLTQLGTSIGTPAYMAPEQAAGDPAVDHRADIYSFGCMAYEPLAGRPLLRDRTPEPIAAARQDVPAIPSGAAPAAPSLSFGGSRMLRNALLFYLLAFVVVNLLARVAMLGFGLLDWVFRRATRGLASRTRHCTGSNWQS